MAWHVDRHARLGALQRADRAAKSTAGCRRCAVGAVTKTSFVPPLAVLALALAAIVTGIKILLQVPGIPYNVSELFLNHGSVPALGFFALGLLWIGGGAMIVALVVTSSRRSYLLLPI